MKDPSDLQIDRLLEDALDAIAHDFDRDYGLPIFDVLSTTRRSQYRA